MSSEVESLMYDLEYFRGHLRYMKEKLESTTFLMHHCTCLTKYQEYSEECERLVRSEHELIRVIDSIKSELEEINS